MGYQTEKGWWKPLNDSLLWGDFWKSGSPWFHCRKCVEGPDKLLFIDARLSINANFCPQCGAKIEWPDSTVEEKAETS